MGANVLYKSIEAEWTQIPEEYDQLRISPSFSYSAYEDRILNLYRSTDGFDSEMTDASDATARGFRQDILALLDICDGASAVEGHEKQISSFKVYDIFTRNSFLGFVGEVTSFFRDIESKV